jgi:hypothetical protein
MRAIDLQQPRFTWLSGMAIIVSVVHMGVALAFFSRAAWVEHGAAPAMTGLVDVDTWALAGYIDYACRQLSRSRASTVQPLMTAAVHHNESLRESPPAQLADTYPPAAAPVARLDNGKSSIATKVVASILTILRESGIMQFAQTRNFAQVCGWTSPSSGSKAVTTLLRADRLRENDGDYIVITEHQA